MSLDPNQLREIANLCKVLDRATGHMWLEGPLRVVQDVYLGDLVDECGDGYVFLPAKEITLVERGVDNLNKENA